MSKWNHGLPKKESHHENASAPATHTHHTKTQVSAPFAAKRRAGAVGPSCAAIRSPLQRTPANRACVNEWVGGCEYSENTSDDKKKGSEQTLKRQAAGVSVLRGRCKLSSTRNQELRRRRMCNFISEHTRAHTHTNERVHTNTQAHTCGPRALALDRSSPRT